MKSWRWMYVCLVVTLTLGLLTLGCSVEGGIAEPECGNGVVEQGEQCDLSDLDANTCDSLGYVGGILVCDANCMYNVAGCQGGNPCGNGIVDPNEECDSAELNGSTCESLERGFNGGTLKCSQSCSFDTSDCTAEVCGNGVIGPEEDCEGNDLGGATCESINYGGGILACYEWSCEYDISGCAGDPCGNGMVDYGEECDGADLNGETCESQGFDGGQLSCYDDCWLDVTQCNSWCGNGIIDGQFEEDCDGSNLNGMTCLDLGFEGGTLGCDAFWCLFDTFNCVGDPCGNGILDVGEECDGTNLNGETCESLGYPGGVLGCFGCYFDTWGCDSLCGNGVVDEDAWEYCDGNDLNGETCVSMGYAGGTLTCDEWCWLDTSQCEDACGNGVIDPNEECDGANLNGQTCQSQGYAGGSLGCDSYCDFDTRNCLCPGDDQYEPNGTPATAATIQRNFTSSGLVLCGTGDEDWFQITLNARTIYAFDVTFLHDEGDVDAYLYSVGNTDSALTSGTSTTDNESLVHAVSTATAGVHYIRILRYSAPTDSQNYGLAISAQQQVDCVDSSDCTPGMVCSSNQCLQAAQGDTCYDPIVISSLPFATSGVDISLFGPAFALPNIDCTGFGTGGKDVFYKLDLSAGQAISVSVTSDFDAAVYLISDCSATVCLAGADRVVSNDTESVEYTASSAGPVYIVVDHYINGLPDSGFFDLTVSAL